MLTDLKRIEVKLKDLKLNKKDSTEIVNFIKGQLIIYEDLKLDISNLSVIVVLMKDNPLYFIRVLDNKVCPMEVIEDASEKVKKILGNKKLAAKLDLLYVSFKDNGKDIQIEKCNSDILESVDFKKVKSVVYGVSDYKDTILLDVSMQDVKGVDPNVFYGALKHSYNKRVGRNVDKLNCYVVKYLA